MAPNEPALFLKEQNNVVIDALNSQRLEELLATKMNDLDNEYSEENDTESKPEKAETVLISPELLFPKSFIKQT